MKRQLAFVFTAALLLLAVSVGGTRALAQDATPEATQQSTTLSYGTPVNGAIDNTNYQQNWTLGTASADRISVTVQRTSGNLVPDVQILDATGSSIAQSYGADKTYAAATIDDFTLPGQGQYTVQVSRENADSGTTTGGYTLTVTPLGTGADNPNNQTMIGEVKPDTPVDGEVTATRWYNLYTYNAQAADTLDVSVKRTGGTLEPVVYVLDSNGQTLQTGYNNNATADTNAFDLPGSGQFTIAVSRNNDQKGDTLGTFELTVHLVGSGDGSPNLKVAPGTISYDQPVTGTISGAQWYQDWTFQATAADQISITITRTDGDLVPEISFLGGSGQEINHGYTDNTGATATIDHYSLTVPGTYTVRATRTQGQKGDSTGSYSLTLALNGAGEGSPDMAQSSGDITLGTPVQGEVTNARWSDTWSFKADKAGAIIVTVQRTDGTLVPTLQILDANKQQLTSAYSTDTRDSSTIDSFNVPNSGQYYIVVGRDSDQSGATTGQYTLTVSVAQ